MTDDIIEWAAENMIVVHINGTVLNKKTGKLEPNEDDRHDIWQAVLDVVALYYEHKGDPHRKLCAYDEKVGKLLAWLYEAKGEARDG